MKRTALVLGLLAAACSLRAEYETLPIAADAAIGDYIRFESRAWAAELDGEGGRLSANAVWTGEHIIASDVYVPSGVTLTINPGATVSFCEGTRIKVEDGGALNLVGEAGGPVRLVGREEGVAFPGIVLQSGNAGYSDNNHVLVEGFGFGKFATVNISDASAFIADGKANVPVNVSGSRDKPFALDWVAETNGVAFASGTLNWNNVSEGRKIIVVDFPTDMEVESFVVRATKLFCASSDKRAGTVELSSFRFLDIAASESTGDYIAFETETWNAAMGGEAGRLTGNTVWTGEHLVSGVVYVPSGVTLTIRPGAVISFAAGTYIKVEDGGRLELVGEEGNDVTLKGVDASTVFKGLVRMSNGTIVDNNYVRIEGFSYSNFAQIALNNTEAFRTSGLALIPVTVSGSRDAPFSADWVAETNGVAFASGVLNWNRVSDGTKNISISFGDELRDVQQFTIRIAVSRASISNPGTCTVKIKDFEELDIASSSSMADYIRFNLPETTDEGGRLSGNVTWTGLHTIATDLYIPSGVTLTLSAGATVAFGEGTKLKIEDGGALRIVGEEGNDVFLRGADGVTNYVGVVKMANGSYSDNMYVQYPDRPYANYPNVTVNPTTTYREAGKVYVAFTLSGPTRDQRFNIDWSTAKGERGTLTWERTSEGTKWIELPVDSTRIGETEVYALDITAGRGCNVSVRETTVTILEPSYSVTDIVAITDGKDESPEFAVDEAIKRHPIFLNDIETITYNGQWRTHSEDAVKLQVVLESDNGRKILKEAELDEAGSFAFRPHDYPVGRYTLKQEIVDRTGDPLETLTKAFSVAEIGDVVLHGGTITSNEVWHAGQVHVVYETIVVPALYTLFIEPGSIVKFYTGTGIELQQGAALFANAIIFTHIDDDTVGGDTLSDGFVALPPMDGYFLTGDFTFGDDAELRNLTQRTALTGTINGTKMLSKGSTYRVSGTLTIANGAKLTIPAGTVLKMEAGAQITVNAGGELIANGTRAAPIVITSIRDDSISGDTNGDGDKTLPYPGDWKRIDIAGRAEFNYTRIAYGSDTSDRGALNGTSSGVIVFDNGIIESMKYECVRSNNSSSFVAHNSVFRDAAMGFGYYGGSGTYAYNCVIADCSIACRASNKHFINTVFYNCLTFLESTASTADHCIFYNSPDWGAQTASQVGQNDNVWGDPLFVDPDNGDFRIREGSPCVDAADSEAAPELDFYGQPRITISDQGTDTAQGQLADIGICELMPRNVTSDIDFIPESVRIDKSAHAGELVFVKWTIRNDGGVEIDGSWRDSISLVSTNGREIALGEKMTKARVAPGGTVFCSGYFTVPAVEEGVWLPKVNVNSHRDIFEGSLGANNAMTGSEGVEISIRAAEGLGSDGVLNAGMPTVVKLTLADDDTNRMVRITVPSGVKVLYGFGFVPNIRNASGSLTSGADGALFRVPDGVKNVYVVLESETSAQYEIARDTTKMEISSVSPNTLPYTGHVRVMISGAGFDESTTVVFENADSSVTPSEVKYENAKTIVAMIDCAELVGGRVYDVKVENGVAVATMNAAISVSKVEGKGILEISQNIPQSVRAGRIFTFTVTCKNAGTADLSCPLITVEDSGSDKDNPIMFSLDGQEFTRGILQFISTDARGGFDGIGPGEEYTFKMFAKMPARHSDTKGISVRANTENDKMSLYRTEVDRYWTPAMQMEYALSEDSSFRDRGELLKNILGDSNGEMVQNLACFAKELYAYNGVREQQVSGLLSYALAGSTLKRAATAEKTQLYSVARQVDKSTGAFLYPSNDPVDKTLGCLANAKKVAIIAHGWTDGYGKTTWMKELASALRANGYDVVYVNWSKEAEGWLRSASGRIPDVAEVVANQLRNAEIPASRTVLIGHSLGSHLMGYVSRRLVQMGVGVVDRHIGLDTATDISTDDDIEVITNLSVEGRPIAHRTEYYRSTSVAGANEAYAEYNFIVAKTDGLVLTRYSKDGIVADHGYSYKWFINNVMSNSASKIGLWFEPDHYDIPFEDGAYIGVINGDKNKLECIYPYEDSRFNHKNIGFKYPGNQKGWVETLRMWSIVADYRIEFDPSFRTKFKAGVPKHIVLDVVDDADIRTCNRYHKKKLTLYFHNGKDGHDYYLKDIIQDGNHFDFDLSIPKSWIDMSTEDHYIKFIVSHGTGALNEWISYEELYPQDNVEDIRILIEDSDEPVAIINDRSDNGFVLTKTVSYESQEKFNNAVTKGEMIDFKFDGSRSVGGGVNNIRQYMWRQKATDSTFIGDKSTLTCKYSATVSGRYPITLTIVNSQLETSTVTGFLDIIPIIEGDGDPIEEPQSYDPNEMVGPMGVGDSETERYVKPGDWMTYTVYFENKAEATAAAQEVTVTNPLSEYLDWSTFEMGEVAFNNQIDLGLSGKQNGESVVDLKDTNYKVKSTVKLDQKEGKVDWYLRIVDPSTDTGWPDDVFAGFLPPNDETFRGEGHLTYRVKVREDAPALARIDNAATIIFDYNDPIPTDPAWWNTVAPEKLGPKFVDSELSVYEGETAEIKVFGGSTTDEMSAKLYLTHNTSSAADIQKGLKFPMTLTWAKGEIGYKTISIPTLVDKAIEDEEFFTCHIDESVITVTIKDAGFEELALKIEEGTASAAEIKTWQKLLKAKKLYARAIPSPYEGGKVSGSKAAAVGAKMSFKATANKGYAPIGWYEGENLITKDAAYSFIMPQTNVTYVAKFMKADEDAKEITIDVGGTTGDVDNLVLAATNLYVGVKVDMPVVSSAISATTVKIAKLPAGLKYDAKLGMITGVPTKAGTFNATFTVTTAGKISKVFSMPITTTALPSWAVGTFNGGLVDSEGEECGLVTLTTTAAGKISGKILKDGLTWTVSAASFDKCDEEGYHAILTAKSGKLPIETYEIVFNEDGVSGSNEAGETIEAYWNFWKTAEGKLIGKALAANPEIKKNGLPLPDGVDLESYGLASLTLKFAASGAVTATGMFDVGAYDKKGNPSYYKATCSTVLISAKEGYRVHLYFAPNAKKNFDGEAFALEMSLAE